MFDYFGIKILSPSLPDGRLWYSKWDKYGPRSWAAGGLGIKSYDPFDNESYLHSISAENGFINRCTIDGNGIMRMEGPSPRLYVNSNNDEWLNVEITCYCYAVIAVPNAGSSIQLTLCGRTDADNSFVCPCDVHGYYGQFTSTGVKQIRKELVEGVFGTNVTGTPFGGSTFPVASWVGMKLIIRNKNEDADVDIKVYQDLTNGVNGGTWTQVVNTTDAGAWGGVSLGSIQTCIDNPDPPCKRPTLTTTKVLRDNAKSCFLENNNWVCDYKWFSVREIKPLDYHVNILTNPILS